ncbi:hypothetical protein MHN28_08765 [Ruegeria sp. Ofav3-42]|nr:hypothetical protein [Ruegeria sp. Ofav3-42]
MSQVAFAELGGVGKHAQINYESGKRKPDSNYLTAIADAGVDVLYVLTGEQNVVTAHTVAKGAEAISSALRGGARFETVLPHTRTAAQTPESSNHSIFIDGTDYATVARYDVEAAAGPGTTVDLVEQADRVAFRRTWLDRIGVKPENAALLRARGHSMEPFIWDGDLLMIDTTRIDPDLFRRGRKGIQDAIFVLEYGGDLRVKSVRRPEPDKVLVYSEKGHRYDPEVYQGEEINNLRFVGRVVWWAHTAV